MAIPPRKTGKNWWKFRISTKVNPDNIPDTLESQLEALKDIGFNNVDCFYKYGIFALFGGSR